MLPAASAKLCAGRQPAALFERVSQPSDLMAKKCPSCKSFNLRRSTVRASEITLRHLFVSPYRCRDCRTRFWVLSQNTYYLAAILGGLVAVVVLGWHARALIDAAPKSALEKRQAPDRLAELLKLAENNDPIAEYEIAQIHGNGYGVPKSQQEEQKWLARAANHGNVQAQYEFGLALRDGRGTVQDYEEARKWMQLAAEGGSGPAQLALGMTYRTGLGTPINNVKAYVWLNVAAAQGVPGATSARDGVLPRLTPTELQEAQAEARRLSELYIPKPAAAN